MTIREHLLVIIGAHRQETVYPMCYAGCAGSWPCTARLEAEAALAILDGADWQFDQQRLIPDPKRRTAVPTETPQHRLPGETPRAHLERLYRADPHIEDDYPDPVPE